MNHGYITNIKMSLISSRFADEDRLLLDWLSSGLLRLGWGVNVASVLGSVLSYNLITYLKNRTTYSFILLASVRLFACFG